MRRYDNKKKGGIFLLSSILILKLVGRDILCIGFCFPTLLIVIPILVIVPIIIATLEVTAIIIFTIVIIPAIPIIALIIVLWEITALRSTLIISALSSLELCIIFREFIQMTIRIYSNKITLYGLCKCIESTLHLSIDRLTILIQTHRV